MSAEALRLQKVKVRKCKDRIQGLQLEMEDVEADLDENAVRECAEFELLRRMELQVHEPGVVYYARYVVEFGLRAQSFGRPCTLILTPALTRSVREPSRSALIRRPTSTGGHASGARFASGPCQTCGATSSVAPATTSKSIRRRLRSSSRIISSPQCRTR